MARLRSAYARLDLLQVGRDTKAEGPPIVFCSDESFSFHTRVALASIFLRTPETSLDIVVFAYDWHSDTAERFHQLAKTFGRSLSLIPVDDRIIPSIFKDRVLPRVAFLRLVVPLILDCDRLLYLDSDLLVQTDLTRIWNDLRLDMLLGGVTDFAARDFVRRFREKVPDLYINSGVLLFSTEAWHTANILDQCADWFSANSSTPFADQDTINGALSGRIYEIPENWNVTRANGQGRTLQNTDPGAFRGIIHFAGRTKPWHRWCDPWSREIYLQYARVVGLPPNYWVEATTPAQALAEAYWEEQLGNIVKANAIYRAVTDRLLKHTK